MRLTPRKEGPSNENFFLGSYTAGFTYLGHPRSIGAVAWKIIWSEDLYGVGSARDPRPINTHGSRLPYSLASRSVYSFIVDPNLPG